MNEIAAQGGPSRQISTEQAFEKTYQEMCALWENQDYTDVATNYAHFVQDNPTLVQVLNQSPSLPGSLTCAACNTSS